MHTNTLERFAAESAKGTEKLPLVFEFFALFCGQRKFLNRVWLGGLLAMAFSASAQAWWNSEWTLRKQITLDPSAAGLALTDVIGAVPVLVRLSDGNLRFSSAQSDGSDLRFIAADDKTPLTFHIEKFDPLLNEAIV